MASQDIVESESIAPVVLEDPTLRNGIASSLITGVEIANNTIFAKQLVVGEQTYITSLVWTATDIDTASWASGTITLANGNIYSIDAGNTGNITVTTYVYFDPTVSKTVLQTTTTYSSSLGQSKILLAIVQKGASGSECIIEVLKGLGTTIDGNKIVTGSISADKITTGSLVVGTNVGIGTAQTAAQVTTIVGNTITTGYVNALAITVVGTLTSGSIDAGFINAGTLSASRIASGSITADKLSVSSLSAITADLGTVTAGTIDGLTINMPRSSTGGGSGTTGYLKWGGQSKMWSDTNNQIGINSIGSPMYIYVGNNERLILPSSGQTTVRDGVYADGHINANGTVRCNKVQLDQQNSEGDIDKVNLIKGYNDVNFQLGSNSYYFSFYNSGFDEKAHIDSSGNIQKDGSVSFDIIHPEIPHYRLRYPAIEAPEVALKIRGIAKLVKGVATITTPHHWELVNEKDGLITVLVTPLEDCKGLYTPKNKMTFTSFEVREMQNGKSNVEFSWELTCVRKNYLKFNPEYPMTPEQIEKMEKMAQRKLDFINQSQKEIVKMGMPIDAITDVKDVEVLIYTYRALKEDIKNNRKEVKVNGK